MVYEERYIDEPTGFSRFARFYAMPANMHLAVSRQGAGFGSPLKNSGLFKYGAEASGSAVKTADPSYVIASVEDLSVRSDIVCRRRQHLFPGASGAGQLSGASSGREQQPADTGAARGGRMSDTPLGRYHFLTWARRGIGATVSNPDGGSLPSRASLSVQLSVSVQQGATTNTVQPQPLPVQMFGPGDVIGVDPRHVIRTEPRDSTVDVRAQLPLRHRVRHARFSLAVHARRAQ